MQKKLFSHAFNAALNSARPTKTLTNPDGSTVELVALPVLPPSPFKTTDGRSGIEFSYDAAQVIANFNAKGRRIPLDIEHNTERGAEDTRARGWGVALTDALHEADAGLEPGVLYGWFELTALGAQELGDKLYGFTSAVALGFWVDATHVQFTRIKSHTLTNNPGTEMPMAFSAADAADVSHDAGYTQENFSESDAQMLEQLKTQLGLAADADVVAVEAAVAALQASAAASANFSAEAATSLASVVALTAQLETATTELASAKEQLTALNAAAVEAKVGAAVEAALTARKITPAQREAMTVFARADLAAFTAAMAAAVEVLPAGNTVSTPAADATFGLTAEQLNLCKSTGIDPAIYAKNLQNLSN